MIRDAVKSKTKYSPELIFYDGDPHLLKSSLFLGSARKEEPGLAGSAGNAATKTPGRHPVATVAVAGHVARPRAGAVATRVAEKGVGRAGKGIDARAEGALAFQLLQLLLQKVNLLLGEPGGQAGAEHSHGAEGYEDDGPHAARMKVQHKSVVNREKRRTINRDP